MAFLRDTLVTSATVDAADVDRWIVTDSPREAADVSMRRTAPPSGSGSRTGHA